MSRRVTSRRVSFAQQLVYKYVYRSGPLSFSRSCLVLLPTRLDSAKLGVAARRTKDIILCFVARGKRQGDETLVLAPKFHPPSSLRLGYYRRASWRRTKSGQEKETKEAQNENEWYGMKRNETELNRMKRNDTEWNIIKMNYTEWNGMKQNETE